MDTGADDERAADAGAVGRPEDAAGREGATEGDTEDEDAELQATSEAPKNRRRKSDERTVLMGIPPKMNWEPKQRPGKGEKEAMRADDRLQVSL